MTAAARPHSNDSPPLPPNTHRLAHPRHAQHEATIWPRTAAVAERLWSYDVTTTHTAPGVAERLAWFRCYLLAQGIGAAPLNNADARAAPPGPGSCLTQ